jgi:hypothetical protein
MGSIEKDTSNNSSIVVCVFIAAVRFSQSRCLAKMGGYTYRHTDWGFMTYAFEMGSGAVIYTKFYKDLFRHSKLMGGGGIHRHTDSMVYSKTYFYFFKIRKVG